MIGGKDPNFFALGKENDLLRQQIFELKEQLEVKNQSEQKLLKVRAQSLRQLTRINTINHFLLRASFAFEPLPVLGSAIQMLLATLPFHEAVAFIQDGSGTFVPLSADSKSDATGQSQRRLQQLIWGAYINPRSFPQEALLFSSTEPKKIPHALKPFHNYMLDLFSTPPIQSNTLFLALPLHNKKQSPLGLILMREQVSSAHLASSPLEQGNPDEADLSFIQLATRHIEHALENALLHQQVEQLAARLETRVEERTKALARANTELQDSLQRLSSAQSQLVHSGKMAAVGTLVAGLSHELNNPTGIILGFAQSLLENWSQDDPNRGALIAIERQAKRCAALVQALLRFSRKSSGGKIIYSCSELLRRVFEVMEVRAQTKNVMLEMIPILTELEKIEISLEDMEAALVNLVENAIAATPPGGRVLLSANAAQRGGILGVELLVEDDGEGIPSELLSRIFEPFFTTKEAGSGTGLGMSLAHKTIELHDGIIQVQSKLGEGTLIRVWLPCSTPQSGNISP